VPHRDAVANADSVEFEGYAARLADALLDPLGDLVEVAVPRDDVRVGVADADERLLEIVALDAGGHEEAAVRGTLESGLDLVAVHEKPGVRGGS